MRENDTEAIAVIRREAAVYKGFQRFPSLEAP